ncbi:uncharacterized protein LOC113686190 [Pocillopora damicornis]|uniref:uncharacterized protein LOC113686190 n=1 Tax=Pocillopora damicornis TaxID=46731 RepID=UPI000F54DDA4|nr:uncharacterized protein LOC113686190 [Pocillopora damicornis]
MMSTGLEKVDAIEDILKAGDLMKSFGLSTTGLRSIDEMKSKLREHLKELEETSSRKIGETHVVISDAGKSDADKRRKLLDLYKRTEQFMGQFEEDFLEIFQKSFEDLNKSLQERKQNVEPSDQYVVLVAGETSAGKSSVINLILGEDLLPSKTLSTTSTICELKYGEKPMVGVHYKPTGTKIPEPAFHELNNGRKTFKEQIEKFVYAKEDREKAPYEKIELFFPHPLFKENVMIVDSPGVGESDVMSSFVLNYLPRAFCFMYVLSASNAGGIQPDRVRTRITGYYKPSQNSNKILERDWLSMNTRWLEDLLDRMSRQVRIRLKSAKMSHQETEEKIKRLLSRMEELQNSQKRIFDELSEHQSKIFEDILEKLALHFKSEGTISSFCDWSEEEVPKPLGTWRETKNEVLKCVSERTHQFVQHWENEENEFDRARVSLIQHCCKKYDIMEEEMREVAEDFFIVDEVEGDLPQDEGGQNLKRSRVRRRLQTSTAPPWLRQGLASVVVGSPLGILGTKLKRKLHYKTKLDTFRDDPCAYMSKRSQKCLKVISTRDRLLPFINEQLEDAVLYLRRIKEKIPKLREGDELIYQRLLEDERGSTEIRKIYEPLNNELESLRREITVYTLREIKQSDFAREELECDFGNFDSVIGRGSFSTVFRGVLHRKGSPEIMVAIKMYSDLLTTNNVWHFVDEERALRKLRHPNIVGFYGTNLHHGPNGTKVMIVLELCSCSLRYRVHTHPEDSPARSSNDTVKKKVLSWAQHILEALHYIHSEGFVHRDLKLENLLLTQGEKVKLADVGVAKHEKEITGTMVGTSLYLAPEVFEGRIYNSKADMYSFGFVLWEIWYGEQAFQTAMTTCGVYQLEKMRQGCRPAHIEGTNHPWEIWKHVMTNCWNEEPRVRLTAKKALESFKELQEAEIRPKRKPVPLPRSRSRPLSQSKTPPSTKPKPARRPNKQGGVSVSYYKKVEAESVHFELKEKK